MERRVTNHMKENLQSPEIQLKIIRIAFLTRFLQGDEAATFSAEQRNNSQVRFFLEVNSEKKTLWNFR